MPESPQPITRAEVAHLAGLARIQLDEDELDEALVNGWLDEHTAARAREEGVERFSASVLADNAPAEKLFRHMGDAHRSAADHGVVELVMDGPDEGIPEALGRPSARSPAAKRSTTSSADQGYIRSNRSA